MQIFIKGEEVPGTNKDEDTSQHRDPAAVEPGKAADSWTPVDPDVDKDKDTHVLGSGDCKTALVAQEAVEPVDNGIEFLGFGEKDSEGHISWLLEDCGCVGLVHYHTTKVRRLKLSTSDSQKA